MNVVIGSEERVADYDALRMTEMTGFAVDLTAPFWASTSLPGIESSQNPSGPAHCPLVSASLSCSCTFLCPASTCRQFGVPSLQTAKAGAAGVAAKSAPAMTAPVPTRVAILNCFTGVSLREVVAPSWAYLQCSSWGSRRVMARRRDVSGWKGRVSYPISKAEGGGSVLPSA